MSFLVDVEDSLGKDSSHSVFATTIPEARIIGRNLHILKFNYSQKKILPEIWTFIERKQNEPESEPR